MPSKHVHHHFAQSITGHKDAKPVTVRCELVIAILIAGDSGFVPGAEHARRSGVNFVLDPLWSTISDSLHEHKDGLFQCEKQVAVTRVEGGGGTGGVVPPPIARGCYCRTFLRCSVAICSRWLMSEATEAKLNPSARRWAAMVPEAQWIPIDFPAR